jgi:hypothetical protein
MYINTFKYTPKDVSCQLCTEYVKKLGCTALRCPWLAERIEAGVVGYREAVMETFPRDRRLSLRLNLLIKHYPGSLWSNEQHERRMQYQCAVQGYRRRRDTNAYYAAMYLLTSNDDIYRRTANCFCKGGIEFGYGQTLCPSPPIPTHGVLTAIAIWPSAAIPVWSICFSARPAKPTRRSGRKPLSGIS